MSRDELEEEIRDGAAAEIATVSVEELQQTRRKAAANVERAKVDVEAAHRAQEVADRISVKEALGGLMSRAEAETGLTREELLAQADENWPTEYEPDMRARVRERMVKAGAPERHIRNVHDQPPIDCDAMRFVREFMAGPKAIMVLSGGMGTYKSGSACWALGQRKDGVYVKAKHLSYIAIDDKPMYLRIARAPLVVLDEIGLERADEKGHWLSTFVDLFDDWYASCAKVVIAGNISLEKFKAYDERVYDRLKEVGVWKNVGGESVRGK